MHELFFKSFFKIIILKAACYTPFAQTKNQQEFQLKKMDSSNAPSISSTGNQLYFKGPYRRQNWSLPDSIIYYMAKNPKSPKCYQKLIKSCKYFFSKNSIIVCTGLGFNYGKKESEMEIEHDGEKKHIDLKDVSQSFWITDFLFVYPEATGPRNVISSLITKIYRCDINELYLHNQIISFNELLFLKSKAYYINLKQTIVKNEDGSVVPFEKIVETFIQVEFFDIIFNENDSSVSSKTAENLIKIPHFSTKRKIVLEQIPEIFDIEIFYDYMKKNKHTFFDLHFNDSISEVYENRLSEIVDEILATENRDYKPPFIDFNGLSFEQNCKLRRVVHGT